MKELLEYRESDYFNDKDYYLLFTSLNRFYVTQLHFHNGNWYSNMGLKYKMTSVPCINLNEILHKEVQYVETTLTGVIGKFLEPNYIGVVWKQGQEYRKYGLPYFWNDVKNLVLK
jgi:hypothetical protein